VLKSAQTEEVAGGLHFILLSYR